MNWIHALRLGIRRHPVKFFVYWFAAYSVIWTLLDSAASVLPAIKVTGALCYSLIVLASLLFALLRAYPPGAVKLKVPGSVTRINVSFGDVFTRDGFVAIPVNEFFDSELGDPVSPHSLHGMVIDRYFGGHPAAFDQLIATELAGVPSILVESRTGSGSLSKNRKFGVRVDFSRGGHVPPFACLEHAELPSACGGRVTFLCWPKEKSPKEMARKVQTSLACPPVSGFFDRTSLSCRKTAVVLTAALRVYDWRSPSGVKEGCNEPSVV